MRDLWFLQFARTLFSTGYRPGRIIHNPFSHHRMDMSLVNNCTDPQTLFYTTLSEMHPVICMRRVRVVRTKTGASPSRLPLPLPLPTFFRELSAIRKMNHFPSKSDALPGPSPTLTRKGGTSEGRMLEGFSFEVRCELPRMWKRSLRVPAQPLHRGHISDCVTCQRLPPMQTSEKRMSQFD